MPSFLLDTEIVIHLIADREKLSDRLRSLLEDERTPPVVSAASVWEIAIKQRKGKLDLPDTFFDELFESDFSILTMTEHHALAAGRLPRHHDDPFDRMLIAQAQIEDLVLVGSDADFDAYDVEVIR